MVVDTARQYSAIAATLTGTPETALRPVAQRPISMTLDLYRSVNAPVGGEHLLVAVITYSHQNLLVLL